MQIPKEYTDDWGMIVTLEQDGGDSAFFMGHYYSLKMLSLDPVAQYHTKKILIKDYDNAQFKLQKKGLARRHPDESKWYGDFDRMSRDQSIPFLISMFIMEQIYGPWEFFKAHLKRGLLFTTNTRRNGASLQNHGEVYKNDKMGKPVKRNYNRKLPDLCGPNFWSIYIRGFRAYPFWPVLCCLDLFLLGSVISFNIKPREPNQLLLLLAFSRTRLPTPLSFVAWRVLNKNKARDELKKYWFDKSHGGKLWRPWFIGEMWEKYLREN